MFERITRGECGPSRGADPEQSEQGGRRQSPQGVLEADGPLYRYPPLIWFLVGYVIPIFFGPALNKVDFLGGPFGFWFAQNGSIYLFWLLILVYAIEMNRLDREFDVHDLEG